MNSGLVSTRYANALLDFAIESGEQERVYAKMKLLADLFFEVPELKEIVQNPSIPAKKKKEIIVTAFGGDLPVSLEKMIGLILDNERENQLQFITQRFIDLYRRRFRIQAGKLITAVPIEEETKKRLMEKIRHLIGNALEIEAVVDPDIIGGFILNLDDYRWDASVSGELERVRQSLKQ
ncbi:MAG: F0F1 ATP synthase subunit delta [Fermentimonas sp.]|jgi:F-type H+-transporting ATPase subunit delta